MKHKIIRETNCLKVNLNKKSSHKKVNNISYVKIKENYDSYHKRNQKFGINQNVTLYNKTSKGRSLVSKENEIKDANANVALLYFNPKRKIDNKKEDYRPFGRNMISMRRLQYSLKVKNAANNKKCKNQKYDLDKIITIQKWIKGYLVRSFLFNASEVEKLINEFIIHINKYIYFKFNFFKKLKKNNFNNIKNINDNFIENKKYYSFMNDNISISNINTNNNTNTFTNNNTFSAGPETPEIFENRNRNRELLINPKRNYKTPSIRELLMSNSDLDKTKNNNKTLNKNNTNGIYIKKLQKAKSSNYIKSNKNTINQKNNKFIYKSIQAFSILDPRLKEKNEINHKISKEKDLRALLFNNINSNDNKIYQKPLTNILFISKVSYYNKKNIINYSPKSEKLLLPKKYKLSLEDFVEKKDNLEEIKTNHLFGYEKIFIDEIKEVKEDEEDDSQSQIIKRINTSFYDDISKQNISESQISEVNIKSKNYNIDFPSSFQINPCINDKKKILIVLLLEKQIKFFLRPYVYNILKNYFKNKIFS